MLERWRDHALLIHPAGLWDGLQAHARFDDWCAAHPGRRCTLWLSSALLFDLVCEPGLPLADDAAALAWARGLLRHYEGEAAADWPLASWQQGALRGVSAWRGLPLAGLRATASRTRVQLHAARPWWSLVLPRALLAHPPLRQGAARLLVVEGAVVTVIELADGRLCGIGQRRLDSALAAPLQAWSAAPAARPTLAVGYGLPEQASVGAGIATLDSLHGAHPAARWLAPQGWRA